MPTCREVAEHATEYLERTMPKRERLGVWGHLRICPNCRAYLRQLMSTIALARRAGNAAAPQPSASEEDRLVTMMQAAARTPKAD